MPVAAVAATQDVATVAAVTATAVANVVASQPVAVAIPAAAEVAVEA
jgi:hypothetical protein